MFFIYHFTASSPGASFMKEVNISHQRSIIGRDRLHQVTSVLTSARISRGYPS